MGYHAWGGLAEPAAASDGRRMTDRERAEHLRRHPVCVDLFRAEIVLGTEKHRNRADTLNKQGSPPANFSYI